MNDNEGESKKMRRDAEPGPKRISTEELMADSREVILEHAGKDYRLRVTALNKLILTR